MQLVRETSASNRAMQRGPCMYAMAFWRKTPQAQKTDQSEEEQEAKAKAETKVRSRS